uniref:DSBA-like thioredoxin domain-containing protein n=1 Tax=Triticum urartu TaxID=4572 RepID=A0A8R7QZM4_TRIUA
MPSRLLPIRAPFLTKPTALRFAKHMASNTGKKLIQIDVSSDTVCPWCFVGKKNLEKAMEQTMDKFDFEVRWHPFFLNPDAPKEGVKKSDFYKTKFGPVQFERATARMREVLSFNLTMLFIHMAYNVYLAVAILFLQMFRGLGFEYDMSGLTGNTMDSHRLITLAGHQGYDKQNALVDELFVSYFCQGKYIGDRQVLMDAARKVGIEGAEELLLDPSKGVDEVKEELNKYSSGISGVPHFVINGKYQLSGGQPPNIFMRAFETAAKDAAE